MSSQKPSIWVGTSWKMNKTLVEALEFADGLKGFESDPRIQTFVIPAFTAVREIKTQLCDTAVKVGAQNMHWDDGGAWTGEVSASMLVDCGLDLVELGHSERRAHFAESNKMVGLKVEAAVRHGLIPLICVGETLEERDADRAQEVLTEEVTAALRCLKESQRSQTILFAYEPVWAIGDGGIPASAEYANQQHELIKSVAQGILGKKVQCLYGGSVNPNNCQELIQCEYIDGLFIGRSAWNIDGYLDILTRCSESL